MLRVITSVFFVLILDPTLLPKQFKRVVFSCKWFLVLKEVGEGQIFCIGICEGSCINPFWEVGGPRFFSQNFLKYTDDPPPPIKNVPSVGSKTKTENTK